MDASMYGGSTTLALLKWILRAWTPLPASSATQPSACENEPSGRWSNEHSSVEI